ncbi:MAG: YdeI/OmpD-associated family protein [Chitinophagales bacterium]
MRTIILDCDLIEELKWGCPCYAFEKKNIVLIHVFKEYCAVLFFKGALLEDKKGILIQQTENVQAARQLRFTSLQQILKIEKTLKAYIYEAVEVEEAGLKVPFKKVKEFKMTEEFQNKLDKDTALKKAFYALTPGRQRGYLLYFASAKQSKTREARIEKYMEQMLDGRGLED